MNRPTALILIALTLAAAVVHELAAAALYRLRGSPAAYAFSSPDADEYVSLARGIARDAAFHRVDAEGNAISGPDTWRTPGYPLLLALPMRLFGDSTATLLAWQQLLAVATVPLLWLVVRGHTSPGRALAAAGLWCLDPFRVYYSFWLLSETAFTLVLLLALLAWSRARLHRPTPLAVIPLGLLTGFAVLVRPIGLPLPLLATLGIVLTITTAYPQGSSAPTPRRRSGFEAAVRRMLSFRPHALAMGVLCLIAASAVIAPWLIRNRIVAGRLALSSQAGASFAYHKAADVLLWSRDRAGERFSPTAQAEIREEIDRRLRDRWAAQHGPLTPEIAADLTWRRLNFGHTQTIDPFAASDLLLDIARELLAQNKRSTVECFATGGVGLFSFPLGLVLQPPDDPAASPFANLMGGGNPMIAKMMALLLGLAYAALAAAALGQFIRGLVRRQWLPAYDMIWPLTGMLALTLPFEDPRFRLPLIPLLWMLAVARRRVPASQPPTSPLASDAVPVRNKENS